MNIVIIGTAFPLRGGIAHYNALLAEALSVRHSVRTITFKRQYPSFLFPGKTQEESGDEPKVGPAPQLVDSINPMNWIRVGKQIRREAPDLLIFKYWLPFFGPCFGTIARWARKNKKTRIFFICDNVIPHEHRPGDRAFTRYAFGAVDGFIVQSGAVEKDLSQFWPGARFKNVPHPVYNIFGESLPKEVARKQLNIEKKNILLFFGYVRKYKGLNVLLDAMPQILEKIDLTLMVVGEFYDDEQKYRSQIAKLGLKKNVIIKSDYVPNEEVGKYFSAADVVILPYLSATQSGIAQIAYNFDKPVIATDVGGLSEVVLHEKTGFVVSPNNPATLAEGVVRFYQEKKESSFVPIVREEKKKYTWDALVKAIEELAQA